MKMQPGEKLVCASPECSSELTIAKTCNCNPDGSACDIEATCCGQPMIQAERKMER